MKNYIYILITLITLSSCRKVYIDPISSRTPGNATAASEIAFINNDQVVKVSLNSNLLKMTYNENVSLIINSDSLQKSYAVIFNEDFKSSQLAKYNFTTTNQDGYTVTNYRESNLNNMILTSKKDTIIGDVYMTKISFSRTFIFSNMFSNSMDAVNTYNTLLKTKDTIDFSSYLTFYSGRSAVSTIKVNVTYKPE